MKAEHGPGNTVLITTNYGAMIQVRMQETPVSLRRFHQELGRILDEIDNQDEEPF